MRHVRLIGVLLVMLIALVIVPAAFAGSVSDESKNPDLKNPACADGCPPGPRPTMYLIR